MSTISIVIPSFGRPHLLVRALRSIPSHVSGDLEAVVAIDHAEPEALRLGYDPVGLGSATEHKVTLCFTGGGSGAAGSRNLGLSIATGEYVAFLDDDDEMLAERFDVPLPKAMQIVVGRAVAESDDGRMSPLSQTLSPIGAGPVPHLGTVLVRRSDCLFFQRSLAASEDVDWWLRMAACGTSVRPVPCELYRQVQHDGERLSAASAKRLAARLTLIGNNADYLRRTPQAYQYQMRRAGGMARQTGLLQLARHLHWESMKSRPSLRQSVHVLNVWMRGFRVPC